MKGIVLAALLFGLPAPVLVGFYPRGVYVGSHTSFDTLSAMGFNLAVGPSSDTAFAVAREKNIKVIPMNFFSATDDNQGGLDYIDRKKTEPAIWAWYPFDEPDIYASSPDTYALWRRQIKQVDQSKPIFLNIYTPPQYRVYIPLSDIFAVDPYPIISKTDDSRNQLERVYYQVRYARTLCGRKPLYAIIQCFYQLPWWEREPEPLELHNMVYQALIGGADGILYYRFSVETETPSWNINTRPDLMQELERINRELIRLEPVLTQGIEAMNVAVNASQSQVPYRIWKYRDWYYLLAANPFKQAQTLNLSWLLPVEKHEIFYQSSGAALALTDQTITIHLNKYQYCAVKIFVKK